MRSSKAPKCIGSDEHPLRFSDIIRWGALLTLGVTAVAIVIAAVPTFFAVRASIAFLWLLTVLAVWNGTFAVGCLVMIPLVKWEISKRLARKGAGKIIAQGRLWDRWMDGPEPSDRKPISISYRLCNDQGDPRAGGQ
jgi:hypothetical protein